MYITKKLIEAVLLTCLSLCIFAVVPTQAANYDPQGCLDGDVYFESGMGCWYYHDNGANTDKPVRVWFYQPANYAWGSGEILFAMHGNDRNAVEAIERWRAHADASGTLIIAPEFSARYYPKGRHYARGNVRDDNGAIRPRQDWTYSTIEEIFDQVRNVLPDAPERYSLQGHSAGGQFVQRMTLLTPRNRIRTAVVANPGWYLMPDEAYRYPCGIGNLPAQAVDAADAYSTRLVLTLGSDDDDPDYPGLNHDACAEMQGDNRFDRGLYFFDQVQQAALNQGYDFVWQRIEVTGVGHHADAMVPAAAAAILGETDPDSGSGSGTAQASTLYATQDTTVKASYPRSNYGARSDIKVDGRSVKTAYLKFDLGSVTRVGAAVLRVKVSDASSGVQYIREAAHNDWNEYSITYNNRPAAQSLITSISGTPTGWASIDLSEYVRTHQGEVITLVMDSTDSNGLYFYSRESGDGPRLEIYP